MIIEIQLEKQDVPEGIKTKDYVLQLSSFEDEGVVFEVPDGYIGHWDDVYTNGNGVPYEELQPGKYIFQDGTVYIYK